jgi:hypothetical protein
MKVVDVSALATATADATSTDGAAATPTATGVTPVVNAASSKTIVGGASAMAVLLAIMMV